MAQTSELHLSIVTPRLLSWDRNRMYVSAILSPWKGHHFPRRFSYANKTSCNTDPGPLAMTILTGSTYHILGNSAGVGKLLSGFYTSLPVPGAAGQTDGD